MNAYATGQRKRRKIYNGSSMTKDVRWHKTGKTKAIFKDGVQIGCKKIMVLYQTAAGDSKPSKMNWVMHQYHLGIDEDEKDGQYVVSKISYQAQKQSKNTDIRVVVEESDARISRTSPRTPKTDAPDPPRPGKSFAYEDLTNDYVLQSPGQESECFEQKCLPSFYTAELKDDVKLPAHEDDSQATDLDAFHNSLLCQENLHAYAPLGNSRLNHRPLSGSGFYTNDAAGAARGTSFGNIDLETLDLGTPPDFNLADLDFPSQDSLFDGIDWL